MKALILLPFIIGCSSLPTTYRCSLYNTSGVYARVIVQTPFEYEAKSIAQEVRDSMVRGNLIPPCEVHCELREVPE